MRADAEQDDDVVDRNVRGVAEEVVPVRARLSGVDADDAAAVAIHEAERGSPDRNINRDGLKDTDGSSLVVEFSRQRLPSANSSRREAEPSGLGMTRKRARP
jgi:hypothetical protein